jgi:hypothetical protein
MCAAQGRNTFATHAECQDWINGIVENSNEKTLSMVYGTNPKFEVRECQCYPVHFDPIGIYFNNSETNLEICPA